MKRRGKSKIYHKRKVNYQDNGTRMGGRGSTVPVVQTRNHSGTTSIALGVGRIVGKNGDGWQGSRGGDEGKKPYCQKGEVDCSIE